MLFCEMRRTLPLTSFVRIVLKMATPNAPEIFRIERMLPSRLGAELRVEIVGQAGHDRVEHGDEGRALVAACGLEQGADLRRDPG